MIKNRFLLIAIITAISGLVAGAIAFYRQQQAGQTISFDIISTVAPKEQDLDAVISVVIDPIQYNQTLAYVINKKNVDLITTIVNCEADLNTTILHCKIAFKNNLERSSLRTDFFTVVQKQSQDLIASQYNNQLEPHLNLLSSSQPSRNHFPSNPYLITLLGLVVGFFLGLVIVSNNSDNKRQNNSSNRDPN